MNYEITNIQPVTVFLTDDSIGETTTIIDVTFLWDENLSKNRIEIKGAPTEEEVLAEITKVGNKLKGQTIAALNIPMKGSI